MQKSVFQALIGECSAHGKFLLENLQHVNKIDDVRYRYFEFYSGTLGAYLVLQQLIDENSITEQHLETVGIKVSERVLDAVIYKAHLTIRSTFFVSSIAYFETAIRRVAKTIEKENRSILTTIENLVNHLGLDSSFIELSKVIFYSRNAALHNGGIHGREDDTIIYKGKPFEFKNGKGLNIKDFDMLFIFSEMMLLFKLISTSEIVSAIPFIKDPFVEEYEKRDNSAGK